VKIAVLSAPLSARAWIAAISFSGGHSLNGTESTASCSAVSFMPRSSSSNTWSA